MVFRMKELPVNVRWMIRRDMPEVLAIEKESFTYPWSENDFVLTLQQKLMVGKVVEYREKVIGYCIYELRKKYLDVLNIAVHPDFRRQGVGSALMKDLKKQLKNDRKRIKLVAADYNLDAHLFYKSQDFRAIDIIKDYYIAENVDGYKFVYKQKVLQEC